MDKKNVVLVAAGSAVVGGVVTAVSLHYYNKTQLAFLSIVYKLTEDALKLLKDEVDND
jgi:hypothetical protein